MDLLTFCDPIGRDTNVTANQTALIPKWSQSEAVKPELTSLLGFDQETFELLSARFSQVDSPPPGAQVGYADAVGQRFSLEINRPKLSHRTQFTVKSVPNVLTCGFIELCPGWSTQPGAPLP